MKYLLLIALLAAIGCGGSAPSGTSAGVGGATTTSANSTGSNGGNEISSSTTTTSAESSTSSSGMPSCYILAEGYLEAGEIKVTKTSIAGGEVSVGEEYGGSLHVCVNWTPAGIQQDATVTLDVGGITQQKKLLTADGNNTCATFPMDQVKTKLAVEQNKGMLFPGSVSVEVPGLGCNMDGGTCIPVMTFNITVACSSQ